MINNLFFFYRLFNTKQIDTSLMQVNLGKNIQPNDINNLNFHSRNLLWVGDFEDTNLSLNTSENLMCPTFINISESKR